MAEDTVRILIIHSKNVNAGNQIYGKGAEYEVDQVTAKNLINSGKAKLLKGKLKKDPVEEAGRMTNQEFLTFVQRNAAEIFQMMQLEADKVNNSPNSEVVPPVTGESEETTDETDTKTSETDPNASNKNTDAGEGDKTGSESDEDAIPEDFPGREILAKNGITTMSAIPRDKEELMKLEQMTGRVANQIGVKLGE